VIVVGVAGDTIHYKGDSNQSVGDAWGALWGVSALLALTISWFMAGWIELVGDRNVTTVFLPVAYFNGLGGWNLDLAAPGYQFFQYTPAYHADRLLRHVFFGSFASQGQIGEAVGVLIAWVVVGLAWYFVAARVVKPVLSRKMKAAWVHKHGPGDDAWLLSDDDDDGDSNVQKVASDKTSPAAADSPAAVIVVDMPPVVSATKEDGTPATWAVENKLVVTGSR
jgi:hypothetical protein